MRVIVLDDEAWAALRASASETLSRRLPLSAGDGPLLRGIDALAAGLPEDRAVHEIARFLETEYEWPEVGYRDWCSVAGDVLTTLERKSVG